MIYDFMKKRLLSLLRIPPEPEPPRGSPDSLRVFRAANGYYRYRICTWLIGRALLGLVLLGVAGFFALLILAGETQGIETLLLSALAVLFTLLYLAQSLFSYATLRLDYEMRWYMITDTSLRIREGTWQVREKTMTFANIQNIALAQGPIQRFFNISDLVVQTAGGGGAPAGQQQAAGPQIHMGYFRGVEDADKIKEIMLDRLRRHKDAGLGDEAEVVVEDPTHEHTLHAALEAMQAEAQALGQAARRITSR